MVILISGDSSFDYASSEVTIKNGTLTFNPVNVDTVGEYICAADNGVGESLLKKVSIKVLGKEVNNQ